MKTAHIIGHRKFDFKGNVIQEIFEWDGPKDGVVRLSDIFLDDFEYQGKSAIGKELLINPYRLKIVDYSDRKLEYTAIRADSKMAQLRIAFYHLTRWLDLIYRRLIITAAVWGLADYSPISMPSWKDLHICKRER